MNQNLQFERSGRGVTATVGYWLDRMPHVVGVLVALGGAAVLVGGWLMDFEGFRSPLPGKQHMVVNTALCFVLCGIALVAVARLRTRRAWAWVAILAATTVMVLASAVLSQHLFGWSLGIDTMLADDPYARANTPPGRMAPITTLGFIFSGMSLIAFCVQRRWAYRWAHWCAAAVGGIGALVVVGYTYEVTALYKVGMYVSMAFNTGICFVLLAVGLAAVRWRHSPVAVLAHSTADGTLARWLLPTTLLVPLVLGGLIVAGESAGAYPQHFSMAMLALGSGLILLLVVWRTATAVEKLDVERLDAYEQLDTQREWLHVTLTSIADGVIATDRNARVILMNDVASALTGWTADDAQGQPVDQVFRFEKHTTSESSENPVNRTLREGRSIELRDHGTLRDRWGSTRPIEDSSAPIRNRDGELIGAVLVFHDVSDRIEAERRRDEFLAMLAHELRNPLAPVLTSAEILEQYDPPPQQKRLLGMIKRQTGHLSRLVDDLLDASRLASGKIKLHPERLRLADVVVQAVETVLPMADKKQHDVFIDIDEASATAEVEADPVRLHQILTNLLMNSVNYTPDGGTIRISVEPSQDHVTVRVIDNGRGIAIDDLRHIFEIFAQADRGLDRAEGGLGLGLAVVRELVERQGGTVSAHSDGPGYGAEFAVALPLLDAAANATETPTEPIQSELAARRSEGHRVLIVEDNIDAADVLSMSLEAQGHDVRVAHDGEEGLKAFAEASPSVVILDIGLPGIDGYEVARRIRAHPGDADVRIIAVTGYGDVEDKKRSCKAGIDYHAVKPVDIERLVALIDAPLTTLEAQ